MELTDNQRLALKHVGERSSPAEPDSRETLHELLRLGLVYKWGEANFGFTQAGMQLNVELQAQTAIPSGVSGPRKTVAQNSAEDGPLLEAEFLPTT